MMTNLVVDLGTVGQVESFLFRRMPSRCLYLSECTERIFLG